MAFNFSAPTPAPAAGGSGFSFGGATTNAAPAPSTSLFGAKPASSTPAPASGGLFGAPAPAPSTGGLFGSTTTTGPAPSTGGLFGSTAAPKPATTGLFGSTPAPAPAGGLFGSTPAAAPAGGLFGSTTTTPAPSTGLFGSTTTPAPAAGSLFGSPAPTMQQQQQQQMQQQMQQSFNGNTPYSQLPDNAKRAIDQIYQLMMQHRRTLASVKTMAPSLLQSVDNNGNNNTQSTNRNVSTPGENLSPADAAAGSPRRPTNQVTVDPSSEPLPQQMVSLQTQIQTLLQSAETNLNEAKQLKERAGEAAVQAKMHGAWPIENVAARRGVALSSIKELVNNNDNNAASTPGGNTTSGTQASSVNVSGMTNLDAIALQQIMDIRASHVDRIESMPSPYYWEVLHNFEQRLSMVQRDVEAVRSRLAIAEEAERVQAMGNSGIMRDETALLRANTEGNLASLVLYEGGSAPLSTKLATLARSQHDYFIRIAALAAQAHDGLEEAKHRYQRFCQTTKGGYYDDPFLKADIEEVSRERELQQRIMEERIATAPPPQAPVTTAPNQTAPSGGLFGAKAPAPSTGLFGSTAAPKPASTGLFGSTPVAAAPAGGLFGATTAPKPAASGGLFGATPAAAPAGGGLFGSNPAPAPAAAGGGLFGSTAPAPAPTTGLFGAPQPAAAPAFGAAPTTPASTLAPRKKSGSRSGGRRR